MKKLIKPMAEDNQSNLFLQLTERWQDGQYAQVADYLSLIHI